MHSPQPYCCNRLSRVRISSRRALARPVGLVARWTIVGVLIAACGRSPGRPVRVTVPVGASLGAAAESLARAYNTTGEGSGRTLSGGLDAATMQAPRQIFGAARKIEGGGSLTIVGTALVDTGSRMDQVIFEEFKGTGNMELILDRKIADRRVFPAIDINRSGTRREELLLNQEELNRVYLLRSFLGDMPEVEAIEFLLKQMARSRNNKEFFQQMVQGT